MVCLLEGPWHLGTPCRPRLLTERSVHQGVRQREPFAYSVELHAMGTSIANERH